MKNLLVNLIKQGISGNKNSFLRISRIDLQNSKYEIFNDKKYTKKLYGDDLFLFFKDKDFVGATIGATYQTYLEDFRYFRNRAIRKNRKGLEQLSDLIIRVPQDQLIYKYRYNKKYNPVMEQPKSLSRRLQNYKNSKVKHYTKEEVVNMIIELNNYVIANINNQINLDKFKMLCNPNPGDLLQSVGHLLKNYQNGLRMAETYKKFDWCMNDMLQSVVEIEKWYNIIK